MSTAKQVLCVLGQEMERFVRKIITAWPCAASICGQRSQQREDRGGGDKEQNSTMGDTEIEIQSQHLENFFLLHLVLASVLPNALITKGLSEAPSVKSRSCRRAPRMWRSGKGLESLWHTLLVALECPQYTLRPETEQRRG